MEKFLINLAIAIAIIIGFILYWKKHSNDIYKRISDFINLHHIMCLIGYKENKLFTHIAKIDKQIFNSSIFT